jgi:predicted nucleic acid-binding Zn ribbon protein
MPTYVYYNCDRDGTQERNVPIAERDNQVCEICGDPLKRKIAFTGLTWAPTAGGMR